MELGGGGSLGSWGPPMGSSSPSASLQQTLYEKWGEYRSLMVQEQRLVRGEWVPMDGGGGRLWGTPQPPPLTPQPHVPH